MTDIYDRATEREEQMREDALAAARYRAAQGRHRQSATHCRVCEEKISLARRRAVPGVQTCHECQTDLERAPYDLDP